MRFPVRFLKPLPLIPSLALTFSLAAFGDGHDVGNGANIVTLPDDTVVLGDFYVRQPDQGPGLHYRDFDAKLQAELERIGFLLSRLGGEVSRNVPGYTADRPPNDQQLLSFEMGELMSRDGASRFIEEEVKSPTVEYHFMDHGKLPPGCVAANDLVDLPAGGESDLGACTMGVFTYIDRSLFREMSVRNQALLIFHERLHHILDGNPHGVICELTVGLNTMMDLFNQQISGARPTLTPEQVTRIQTVIERMDDLKMATALSVPDFQKQFRSWKIVPNGGGLAHPSASVQGYLGIGSILGLGGTLDPGSEMLHSTCYLASCEVEAGALLEGAVIAPQYQGRLPDQNLSAAAFVARIGAGARITQSQLTLDGSGNSSSDPVVKLDAGAVIDSSSLNGMARLDLGAQSRISFTVFNFSAFDPATTIGFSLGEHANLEGLQHLLIARTTPPGNPELRLGITPQAELKFTQDPCQPAQILLLQSSTIISGTADVKALCQNGLSKP